MKILRLRFANLNSLKGEWLIDFRHPAYANEGIFAITGATGAGKSTILDAICLALYGATPRLGLGYISENKNDIMSRQTGECFAEVVFSTNSNTYLAYWGQKRAYSKPDGKLQTPRHEIGFFVNDHQAGDWIETKSKRTKLKIEEITSMDFGRFTRAMLLAQGNFSAFLQADADERSPILEQITGTEIYSDISKKVYEFRNIEKRNLETLQEKLAGFSPLSDSQEQILSEQKQQLSQKIKEQQSQIIHWQHCKNWQENIRKNRAEQQQLQDEQQQLSLQKNAFFADEQRLNKALNALNIYQKYQQYQQLGEKISQNQQKQQSLEQQKPILQNKLNIAEEQRQNSFNDLQNIEKYLHNQQQLFQQVREFDYQISHLQQDNQKQQQQYHGCQQAILQNQTNQNDTQQKKKLLEQQLDQIKNNLQNNELYNSIPTMLVKLENFQQNLLDNQQKQQNNQQSLVKLQSQQQENQKFLQDCEKKYQQIFQTLSNKKTKKQQLDAKFDGLCQSLNLVNIENPLKSLISQNDDLKNQQQHLHQLLKLLENWQNSKTDYQNTLENLTKYINKLRETKQKIEHNLAMQEQQQQQIRLLSNNILLQHKILNLENEREKLLTGLPCPLCGSTTHPYQQQKPQITTLSDNEQQRNDLQHTLKKLQQDWQILSETYHHEQANEEHFRQQQQGLTKKLQSFAEQFYQDYQSITTAVRLEKLPDDVANLDLSKIHQNLNKTVDNLTKNIVQQQQNIVDLENIQHKRDKMYVEIVELEKDVSNMQHEKQLYAVKQSQILAKIAEMNERQQDLIASSNSFQQQSATLLQPILAVFSLEFGNLSQMIVDLQKIYQQYEDQQTLLKQLDREIQVCENQSIKFVHEYEGLAKEQKNLLDNLNTLQQQIRQNQEQRFALFADKQVEAVEKDLLIQKQRCFDSWQEQTQAFNEVSQSWQSLQENLRIVENNLGEQLPQYSAMQSSLSADFMKFGFQDEQDFCQSYLDGDEIKNLQYQREQLYQKINSVGNRLDNLNNALQDLLAQSLTDLDIVAIDDYLSQSQIQLSEFEREIGRVEQQLQHNATLKQNQAELFAKFEQQKRVFDEWEQLYKLIGSHDGKKFRNFAQSLTFDMMINHANAQLVKMSDRYLLTADKEQPLSLNVIDNYQAGIVRTSKNLSGGESFIISLALALGLSNMASHKMQVNSLFLDEGFGTLDEEALDTALDTLSSLQRSGKLIGVISHIPALKERISSKILVLPQTGGVSKIVGEGVSRLA